MGKMQDSLILRSCRRFSTVSAWASIAAAVTVMTGWWLHVATLTSIVPGLVTMKPNTAVSFLLAGIALLILRHPVEDPSLTRSPKIWVARISAAIVIVIGLVSFIERLSGRDLGIDLLFFRNTLIETGVPHPGLMAMASGVAFFLLGVALLALDVDASGKRWPAHGLALGAVLIGFFSLLGYVYGVELLFGAAGYSAVAVNTASIFILLGLGILCARPDEGLIAVLTSDRLGGLMARRLMPIDITARKRADEAVQLAQARLLSALEGGRMGTWVWEITKNRIDWDDALAALFGRSPEELASGSIEPFFSWLHPQDRARARVHIENALQDGTNYDSEYRLFRPDNSIVWINSRGRVERDAQGQPFRMTGICVDITERKKMEEHLMHAQKMEALGTLTGGIAHDFNNILLTIGGNARLAIDELPPDHPIQHSLHEIAKAGARASSLVRQILALSRRQNPDRKAIAVQPVVEEALRLLHATLPARIGLRSSFAVDLPNISADSTQLHQVIMNLGTNAARAMDEAGGVLEVSAKTCSVQSDQPDGLAQLSDGDYVRISVSDSGCGMDRATMERIFDPFFTTHAPGHGTGLGLSVVHGIMKDHDGAITVYSEPGKGTIFHLYFRSAAETADQSTHPATTPRGNSEHLLYVDDEEALVLLARRSLRRLGYQITGYTDPAQALQAFTENPDKFSAVVTDLSMPGMSGVELARQILQIRPDVPIVMTSGYIRPEDELEAQRVGVRELLLKPDTVDDLAAALQRVFASVSANGNKPRVN